MYVLKVTWIDISSLILSLELETLSVSQVSQFTLESTSLCAISIQFELFFFIKKASELDADVCGVRWQGNLIQEMRAKLNLWASKWQNMSVICPCPKGNSNHFLGVCQWEATCVRLQPATNPPSYMFNWKRRGPFLQDTIVNMSALAGTYQRHLQGDRYTLIWVRAGRH